MHVFLSATASFVFCSRLFFAMILRLHNLYNQPLLLCYCLGILVGAIASVLVAAELFFCCYLMQQTKAFVNHIIVIFERQNWFFLFLSS
mmetsp:Transcript_53135/g.79290  ORF Transcript_53135/g.79290 Transcript_53135/m.79290 type:complete len:89 (-) Transcript_53135:1562-1828(-)